MNARSPYGDIGVHAHTPTIAASPPAAQRLATTTASECVLAGNVPTPLQPKGGTIGSIFYMANSGNCSRTWLTKTLVTCSRLRNAFRTDFGRAVFDSFAL